MSEETHNSILKKIIEFARNEKKPQFQSNEKIELSDKDLCNNIRKFIKNTKNNKLESFIIQIEKGEKRFKVKIGISKPTKVTKKQVFNWATKKFDVNEKDHNLFLDAIVKDFLLIKIDNDHFQVMNFEDRKQLMQKAQINLNIQRKLIHEISLNR